MDGKGNDLSKKQDQPDVKDPSVPTRLSSDASYSNGISSSCV